MLMETLRGKKSHVEERNPKKGAGGLGRTGERMSRPVGSEGLNYTATTEKKKLEEEENRENMRRKTPLRGIHESGHERKPFFDRDKLAIFMFLKSYVKPGGTRTVAPVNCKRPG